MGDPLETWLAKDSEVDFRGSKDKSSPPTRKRIQVKNIKSSTQSLEDNKKLKCITDCLVL